MLLKVTGGLQFVGKKFFSDPEFLFQAVKYHGYAFELLPQKYKSDKSFIEKSLKIHNYILSFVDQKLRTNYDFIKINKFKWSLSKVCSCRI